MPNIYKSQPALVYPDVESLVEDILPVTPLNDAVPTETPMVRASHKSFTVPVESPETAGVGENSVISNASLVETSVLNSLPYSGCSTASDGSAVLYARHLIQPSAIRRK